MDEIDALFGDDSDNEAVTSIDGEGNQTDSPYTTPTPSSKSSTVGKLVSNNVEVLESMVGIGGGRGLTAKIDIPAGTLILSEIPSISFDSMNATKSEANALNNKYDMANAIEAIVNNSSAYQCAKHLFPKKLSDIDGAEVLKMKEFLSAVGEEEDQSDGMGVTEAEKPAPSVNLYEILTSDMRKLNHNKLPEHAYYRYIHEVTEHEVLRLALVLQHNCFGSGLYRYISIINHSCMSNCIKFAPTKASMGASEIYTTRNITRGEEVTINYCLPCETSYKSARDYLKENHTFECLCPRCAVFKEPDDRSDSATRSDNSLAVTGGSFATAFATAKGETVDSVAAAAEKRAVAARAAALATVQQELEKEASNESLLEFIEEAEVKIVDVINPPADVMVTWGETSKTCKELMVQVLEKCADILRLDVGDLRGAGVLPTRTGAGTEEVSDTPSVVCLADISKLFVASLMCMDQTRATLQVSGVSVGAAIFKHKLRYTTISLLTRLCHSALRAGHVLVDHYFEQLNNPKLSQARQFEQKQKAEIVLLQMVCVSVVSMYLQTKAHILLGKWAHGGSGAASSCCEHPDMITTYVDLVSTMECVVSLQGQYKPPVDYASTAVERGSLSLMYSLLQPSQEQQQANENAYFTVFTTMAAGSAIGTALPTAAVANPRVETERIRALCKLFTAESKRLKKMYNTILNYNRPGAGSDSRPIIQVLRNAGDAFWG